MCSNVLLHATAVPDLMHTALTHATANSFTPWFRLIARDLLFPWWDEMMAKCAESGSRRVDAKVLRGKVEGNGPVLKLV